MDPPQLRRNLHFSICENIKFYMKLTIFKKDSASHFQEVPLNEINSIIFYNTCRQSIAPYAVPFTYLASRAPLGIAPLKKAAR